MTPFFANGQHASPQTFQYFSFATLTTLGYGDFTALQNSARAVAVIEALAGQVFLATLVARLVAAFRGPSQPARPAVTRRRPPRALRRTPGDVASRAAPGQGHQDLVRIPARPGRAAAMRQIARHRVRGRDHPVRVMPAARAGPQTLRLDGRLPLPRLAAGLMARLPA